MENYQETIEKFKIPFGLILVGAILLLSGFFTSKTKTIEDYPEQSLIKPQAEVIVDVSGAVQEPGIYKLKEGSRVADAVNIAGGLTTQADNQYISKYLNMAQKISDGIKIYIPVTGEKFIALPAQLGVNNQETELININTATLSQLEALSGIGPATANKIINFRPYQKKEDLLTKKVVSKSVFEKIKDLITI